MKTYNIMLPKHFPATHTKKGEPTFFRDGNRQNCNLSNLYLLSREDNARRRVSEETPEARQARVAKAQITRNKSI